MAGKASVVTPERFAKGFTYPNYMAQIKVNKARIEGLYNDFKLKLADADFFKKGVSRPNGPVKMLLLAEDWCGDVVRGLPVFARIAEASGMELKIFPRDQNLDIMNEFLNRGIHQSIPVAVFYTKDHRYIAHWIERPAGAVREITEVEKAIRAEKPGITDQEVLQERRARTAGRIKNWQQDTVDEIKELLSKTQAK